MSTGRVQINNQIAVEKKAGTVYYVHGHLPVFHHAEDDVHGFTVVFDREGYSPELFQYLWQKRIAILTYHKFPQAEWPHQEFLPHRVLVAGGETVSLKLAERGTQLSSQFGCARSASSATAGTRLPS